LVLGLEGRTGTIVVVGGGNCGQTAGLSKSCANRTAFPRPTGRVERMVSLAFNSRWSTPRRTQSAPRSLGSGRPSLAIGKTTHTLNNGVHTPSDHQNSDTRRSCGSPGLAGAEGPGAAQIARPTRRPSAQGAEAGMVAHRDTVRHSRIDDSQRLCHLAQRKPSRRRRSPRFQRLCDDPAACRMHGWPGR